MESDAGVAHKALETIWERLYAEVDGALFERRGDLILALYPPFPIPQCNGPWVVEDTEDAAAAMADAVAEVEAAGASPWVQTRSGHELTRRAAAELGLTYRESVPGMVVRPGELVSPSVDGLAVELIAPDAVSVTNELLAASFGAPAELFEAFAAVFPSLDGAAWYVGRVGDEVVSTALGITMDDVTGVFNVGTAPDHRGRGYGAAVTSRVVEDGFAAGAGLAFLQSSELGHGVYRGLGFRDVEEYVLLTRPAPAA